MARRRRRDKDSARSDAVERERRERLRRERERQRLSAPVSARPAKPGTTKPKPVRPASSGGAGAVAVRERHEGLVAWVARMVMSLPRLVAQLPGALVAGLRGFLREVLAVLAGIGRALLSVVPGVSRLGGGATAVAARTKAVRGARAGAGSGAGAGAVARRTPAQQRADAERRELVRRGLRLALAVGLAAAVIAAWVLVPSSEAFRIRHVEVSGASSVDDLEVRMQADELLDGATVFDLDRDAVAERIEELPFVREASVERHLPGGIELKVVEYRPLALAYGDGKFWLVAQDGRILSRVKGSEWKGRIPLVWLQGDDIEPGVRVSDEPALKLLAAQSDDSTLDIALIRIEDFRLEAELGDGVLVRFGRPVQLHLKLAVAQRTVELLRRQGTRAMYIDVSVPGKPAYCLDKTAACHAPRGPQEDEDGTVETTATTPEEVGGDEATVAEATG